MTVDEVYDDALTRCSFVLTLASNGELDADSQEVAVGAIVEGDDGAFVAIEAGISAFGEPFVSVRVFDRDGHGDRADHRCTADLRSDHRLTVDLVTDRWHTLSVVVGGAAPKNAIEAVRDSATADRMDRHLLTRRRVFLVRW